MLQYINTYMYTYTPYPNPCHVVSSKVSALDSGLQVTPIDTNQ